ncbi:hypothetical protein [Paenibacillus anseongense]|uniref:hypothetical protein n=2 Tax=Paenibacillus TaxID=44249 RepID=UPI002DBF044B|nr:hypothetical protein [Paenibacillus anseongense]MEC0270530.1 hypothetical protein [Paenibacillus anseongense]
MFMKSRFIGTILSYILLTALFGKNITTTNSYSMAWVCAVLGVFKNFDSAAAARLKKRLPEGGTG